MENFFQTDQLPEIIFGTSDPAVAKQISRLEKSGTILKIGPRLYTANITESPATVVRRNLYRIIGHLFPGALLSHRSAFEFLPALDGSLFLTYTYTRKTSLPGIVLRFMQGPEPIPGDNPLAAGIFASQMARAFLENLQVSRKTDGVTKTLDQGVLESKLEEIIRVHGEEGINKLRDEARQISQKLGWKTEFDKLDQMVGALLSTRPVDILTSPTAIARAFGKPYDPHRVELFGKLFQALATREFPNYPEQNDTDLAYFNFAFFESYFSNYIEGTIFEIDVAMNIVTTQKPLPARHDDSHDILGTYKLVASRQEMSRTSETAEKLVQLLKARHQILLTSRKNKNPGQFKDLNNQAGQTLFVDFRLVEGTILKGWDFYRALQSPFARAAYIMFLITEIHPFLDGNGRIARVFMNAELTAASQSKILIPTVYREDYLLALRRLSRQQDADPYIRMLQKAHTFSAGIFGADLEEMQNLLRKAKAFEESSDGKLKFPWQ